MPLQITNTCVQIFIMNVLIFLANLTSYLRSCILFLKDEVWHTFGADLIGPLPETQEEQIHHDSLLSVFQVARGNCSPR